MSSRAPARARTPDARPQKGAATTAAVADPDNARPEDSIPAEAPAAETEPTAAPVAIASSVDPGPAPSGDDTSGGDDLDRLRSGWVSVVTTITDRNRAVKPLITACRPIGVEGNVVTLGFPEEQGFLKDVADRRRPLLEECIGAFLGHDVAVRCVATNLDLLPPLPADADAAHILAEAHRIFAEDLAEVPEVT
jgi:hypothetical protein